MRRLIERLFFATRFGRRLTLLASTTALGQLAVILAAPLLTRLYEPAAYGAFAALTGLITILAVIAALRYEGAIPLCQGDRDAAALTCSVMAISTVFGLLTALIMAAAGPWIAGTLGLNMAGHCFGGCRWPSGRKA